MTEQGRSPQKPARRHAKYTDALKQRCMAILESRRVRCAGQDQVKPAKAIVLGRALKYWPDLKHETVRRRVRELVDEMRREGAPIASGREGYWAAETVNDFERTADFLRRIGLAPLATNARLKQCTARARATGQTRLPTHHAAANGGLAAYLKLTARGRADRSVAAPQPEQSDQAWADSLFALA